MDAGIGCRWIPSAVDERSGGRATGGAGGALAFRPREVSGRAGWAGPRQGFGFSACARTVASVSAATPNGHLQGAGADASSSRIDRCCAPSGRPAWCESWDLSRTNASWPTYSSHGLICGGLAAPCTRPNHSTTPPSWEPARRVAC
jgi:hypothetical protein